jgi:hypothetical protein
MSREIDLDQPLSEDERRYLESRDRWRDLQYNAEATGGEPPTLPKDLPVTGPEATVNALGPTGLTPEQQREYDEEQQKLGEPVDYNAMTVPELKAELDERAKEASSDEEKENLTYKTNETKAALIAKLERDDELVAGADDQG